MRLEKTGAVADKVDMYFINSFRMARRGEGRFTGRPDFRGAPVGVIRIAAAVFAAFLLFFVFSCAGTKKPELLRIEKPSKEAGFLEKLVKLIDAEDFDGAIGLFSTLTPEEAAGNQNIILKSSVLVSAGRTGEARKTLDGFLSKPELPLKDRLEAQFVLSKVEAAENNKSGQRNILNRILKTDPSYVRALNELGYLDLSVNNFKSAERFFNSVLKIEENNLDALLGMAAVLRAENKDEDALVILNDVLESSPQDTRALELRGRLYRQAGNYQEALNDFNAVLKIDRIHYWALYDKGRTLLDMNKKQEALAEFEKAERIEPENFVSYVYSAGIRDDLNDWKMAIRDYETLIKLKPDYYFANEMLGVHLMRNKEYLKAEEAFMTAYFYAPQEANYAMLAVVNALNGGIPLQKLKPFLEQAMKRADRDKSDYHILRLFYDSSGDRELAYRISREKSEREKAKGIFYLAMFYDIKGNAGLAEKYFDEFRKIRRMDLIEWRINEWIMDDRYFNKMTGTTALGKD